MKFTMITSLLCAVAAVNAVLVPKPLDVWAPKILTPNANTVWTHGEAQNVTWDTSDAPAVITGGNSFSIQLGYRDSISPLVIADGLDARKGYATVDVPWVTTGDDYFIVLFGDSGDRSEVFTIQE